MIIQNGLDKIIAKPIGGGTFPQAVASVLELHRLDVNLTYDYVSAFEMRMEEFTEHLGWLYAFSMFKTINLWALADTFGFDDSKEGRVCASIANRLWQSLTGSDPEISLFYQPQSLERFRILGVL